MILSDLGKFFNDTKHRAASLQQLSFLFDPTSHLC